MALLIINRLYRCPPPAALEGVDAHWLRQGEHTAQGPHAHARAEGVAALPAPVAAPVVVAGFLPAKDAAGPTTELLPSQPAEEPIGKQGVGRMRMDFFGQICVAKSGATRWNASDIITEDKTFFRVLLAGIGIVMFSVCIRKAHSPRAGKLTFC